jgi:branched-chain amino acid aminotransferase
VTVFSKPYKRLVDEDEHQRGIRVKTLSVRRMPDEWLYSRVKSINYRNHVLARMEANEAGYDDALELTVDGEVAEAPGYNIFVVKKDCLYTPRENILMGFTRKTVIDLPGGLAFRSTKRASALSMYTMQTRSSS